MGKKKNKFQKSGKHVSQAANPVPKNNNAIENLDDSSLEVSAPDAEPEIDQDEITYAYVKKDVKKILFFILIIIILLIGAYFINSKTTLFQTFGNWIYKISNIQAE